MKATDFTRNDCQFGNRRLSYQKAEREYRCEDCGDRIVQLWDESYPENYHAACVICRSHNWIHQNKLEEQQSEAIEVFAGLPQEMRDLLQPEQVLPERPPGIFSLSPPEPIEL